MISLLPLLLFVSQEPSGAETAPSGLDRCPWARVQLELPPGPVRDTLTGADAEPAIERHRESIGTSEIHLSGLRTWDVQGHFEGFVDHDLDQWKVWSAALGDPEDFGYSTSGGGPTREVPSAFAPSIALAELSRLHGRHADTWAHLARLDAGHLQEALGGLITNLDPVGVIGDAPLLVPLLPPIPDYDPATWEGLPPLREYTAKGLTITRGGDDDPDRIFEPTVFDMTVSVPREGVEVKLQHVSGPPLSLRVKVPVPPHMERSIEYLDWDRQDDLPEYHELTLAPSEEERVIWVRCLAQDEPWPRLPGGAGFPADRELVVRTTADDPGLAQLTAFAEALDQLLPNDVRLDTGSEPLSRDLVLDLSPGPRRLDKLRGIISQVEALVLAQGSG